MTFKRDRFLDAGHTPTLLSAFLYFDISFMIWMLCGALALYITRDFGLSDFQKAFLVSTPLLGGALLRIPMGILADRIGCRRTAMIGMAITFLPLIWGYFGGRTLPEVFGLALLLGMAGASFGVALPLASRWYPPEHQGLAMGIAGAGNSGTALATLFAPKLAEHVGWHGVFGLAMLPLFAVFIAFFLMAKDSPQQPSAQPLGKYFEALREGDMAWFCFFYLLTFGGFSALSSYLGIVFYDTYGEKVIAGGLTKVQIGMLSTAVVIAGSFVRPLGGFISDKIGGMRFLNGLFVLIALGLALIASFFSLGVTLAAAILVMACLGMGNGAIFQLVPQRFQKQIGVATGVIGAAGGFGGFLFTTLVFGPLKQLTHGHRVGFLAFAGFALAVAVVFVLVTAKWRRAWANEAVGVKF